MEQTLLQVADSKSPVQGEGTFKKLSKEYKKKKDEEVGHTDPDLQFSGQMLDQVDYKVTSNGVTVGVFGDRAPAADGHNNLSGKSKLPTRRFIPGEGQNYKANIQKEVDRIISDVIAEQSDFKKSEFKNIGTKTDLYKQLETIFGTMLTRAELRLAVLRNEDLLDLLEELDIVDLL